MSAKENSTRRSASHHKGTATHGSVKHMAKPANIQTVLSSYVIKKEDFHSVKKLVFRVLNKLPANAK
jgi:hypothetical protein